MPLENIPWATILTNLATAAVAWTAARRADSTDKVTQTIDTDRAARQQAEITTMTATIQTQRATIAELDKQLFDARKENLAQTRRAAIRGDNADITELGHRETK